MNLFRVAVENFVRDLNKCPILTGNMVTDITLTANANTRVYHKLGRKPRGWIVTNITESAYTRFYASEITNTYIDIYSVYSVITIDIWFF